MDEKLNAMSALVLRDALQGRRLDEVSLSFSGGADSGVVYVHYGQFRPLAINVLLENDCWRIGL